MKLLTIAIPCYNSAAYMRRCIDSLLPGGEEVEILIVDDGSVKDNTAEIADEYEQKYPTIVKAIHQKNAGHGGAVNTGIAHATGLFFKVVDSDDWVSLSAYKKILKVLRQVKEEGRNLDLLLANYVYDKQGVKHKKIMHYRKILPQKKIFTWDEVGRFGTGKYILMHSVIYRTQLLKDCGLKLPEHTFYVDNIFVFQPFPFVTYMYYLDVNFYHYYIGREDQSVNEKVMISRIDQQILVNKRMIDYYTSARIDNKRLDRYMMNYLNIITIITSILCIRSKDPDLLVNKKEVWDYLKKENPKVYRAFCRSPLGIGVNLPGKAGRSIASLGYAIAQKIYGFN